LVSSGLIRPIIGIISGADINKNNKIDMEEFIYLLMSVSGSK